MIVLSSAVVCCFLPMFVVAGGSGGKKGADAKVAVAGGGAATGGAAEAREKMEVDGSKMVKASLLYSDSVKLPGAEASLGTLAVAFDIEKGWHTYWRNSGDTGMPPTFEFTVDPPGAVEIGEAQWPVPERHVSEGDIVDYIYERRVLHLFEVKRGPAFNARGPVTITCKASWLVCKEACLPGDGEITIRIRESDIRSDTAAQEIGTWQQRLPKTGSAWQEKINMSLNAGVLEMWMPRAILDYFPFAGEGDAIPTKVSLDGKTAGDPNGQRLRLRLDAADIEESMRIRGVLVVRQRAPDDERGPSSREETYAITVDVPASLRPE